MKTKKLLSILLALMMMLSVVPMYASAAEPIALTKSNVVTWPTVEGTCYFGQAIGDALTLVGGEVQYNGVSIPGQFVFTDPSKVPGSTGSKVRADLTFEPTSSDEYLGFSVSRSRDVTYQVLATTPVFVDEINNPVVATEVEAGTYLSTSTLSGGAMNNTYNSNEANLAVAEWVWSPAENDPLQTIVTESKYYTAQFAAVGYTTVKTLVLVRVKGDTSEVKIGTTISELPTPSSAMVGDKLSSVILTGGKAIDMHGNELTGHFTFETDFVFNQALTRSVTIVFTPDDSKYATATTTINITVEKGNFAFLDENGAETVPEITVPYGATMGDVQSALKGLTMNTTENISFNFADGVKNTDKAATGTYNVIVRSYEDNSNYNETTLPVKVTVEQKELTLNGAYSAETKLITFKTKEGIAPRGKFDIYVDGALVKSGVAYGENVAYNAFVASGVHTIKIVYIPKENDGYKIADFEIETQINLARNITAGENTGSISAKINGQNGHIGGESLIVCGDTIELSTIGGETFLGWKIADKNGNIANLGIADLKASAITFTMPDYDIVVTAEYEKQENNNDTNGGFDIDSIFGGLDMDELSQGDSEWAIINIIRNLIAKFKSFLQQLIETFQSIGD